MMKRKRYGLAFLAIMAFAFPVCAAAWAVAPTNTALGVDGILGLPWGATGAMVIQAMREKGFGNIQVDEDPNGQSRSVGGDGFFAGYPARIGCLLINNAMWRSQAGQLCRSADYGAGVKNYLQIRMRLFKDISSLEEPAESNDSPDRIKLYLENHETDQGDNITVAIEFRYIAGQGATEVSYENSTLKQRLLAK